MQSEWNINQQNIQNNKNTTTISKLFIFTKGLKIFKKNKKNS